MDKRKLFFFSSTSIFMILFSLGKYILIDRMSVDMNQFVAPLLLDLIFAFFLVIIGIALKRVNLYLSIGIIICLILFHIANMEYIYALGNVINLRDLHYVTDKDFLAGSLSHISFPVYSALLILASIGMIVSYKLDKKIFTKKNILIYGAACLLILLMQFVVTPANSDWRDENFISLSIMNSIKSTVNRGQEIEIVDLKDRLQYYNEIYPNNAIDDGEPIIDLEALSSQKKNILFVVMEGIPGAYIREVQNAVGIDIDFEMKSFDRIVEHSIVVPNFVTHNNQTIRGLYSILSGDYPKFDASTPKAYEYMQLPEENRMPMIPTMLKEQGYYTSFIQAASLDFMSKDQFMESAGYDQIMGEESLPIRHIPFGWGADDKAFLEQSATMIHQLNKKSKPWFVTLLTVGTHHPYAVPDDLVKQYPNRKMASVAYLDEALNDFIDFIERESIAEDTLIFFLSDESHDLSNQLYGSNWGIMLIYNPEFQQTIHPNVFGHIDIISTIKDLLDPGNQQHSTGRSMFRIYEEDRPILFGSHYSNDLYFSEERGAVYQLDPSGSMNLIRTANGEMFSDQYFVEKQFDSDFRNTLLSYRDVSNNSLLLSEESLNQYLIIDEKEYQIGGQITVPITSGQHIYIPENSVVTIRFDYEIDGVESLLFRINDGISLSRKVIGKDDFKGEMVYQFFVRENTPSYSFELLAQPFITKKSSRLIVSNLSLSYAQTENTFESYTFNWSNLIPFMIVNGISAYPVSEFEIDVLPVEDNRNFVFGPYTTLDEGNYTITYKIQIEEGQWDSGEKLFAMDVTADSGKETLAFTQFNYQTLVKEGEYYLATIPFEIEEKKDGVEFRMSNKKPDLGFVIKEIRLEKSDS